MESKALVVGAFLASFYLGGCCVGGESSSCSSSWSSGGDDGLRVLEAVFCKGLTEGMEPLNPTTSFLPMEKIHLSLTFPGRPRSGMVKATFMYREQKIAEATTDFAQTDSQAVFAVGGKTYVGFWLNHEKALSVSPLYKVVVHVDGVQAGEYPFAVTPPPGALPSKLHQVVLAKGATEAFAPIQPSALFSPLEVVYAVGSVDLGLHSWIQAEWYLSGTQKVEEMTRFLQATENSPSAPFSFHAMPQGGWPPGQHVLKLIVDDQEAGAYPFTVAGAPSAPPPGALPPGAAPPASPPFVPMGTAPQPPVGVQ